MDGFSSFCEANADLWRGGAPSGEAPILVDLCHSVVQYLLRSLTVAKYLQRLQGGRLIGLLGETGVVPTSCGTLDLPFIERLASSYGVAEFWRPPATAAADVTEADELIGGLAEGGDLDLLTPEALRRGLAELRLADGFPIGRLIYETTLRAELRATVDRVDAAVRRHAAGCVGLRRWIAGRVGGARTAFVTGHLDYDPWGLVAEEVRRAGGEVFWFRIEHDVPLFRITARNGTLNAAYHAVEAGWFAGDVAPLREALRPAAEAFASTFRSGALHQRWTASKTAALPAAAAGSTAAAWRRACGWAPDSTVTGVFAHAHSDQPLADAQVFADRYQWLARTVAFAARHPERNWVVKLHPRDEVYDRTGASEELIRRFGRLPHLRFVRRPTAFGAMEAVCDVAVTIFGAPGLEMAAEGRPVIVAGCGPYAGCGFVHRARDATEYEALLLAEPHALRMSAAQVELARLYVFASRVAGAPSSRLLDAPLTPADDAFWRLAASRTRQHAPAADDLFEAMRRMLGDGAARCLNPVIGRHAEAAALASEGAGPELPLLGEEPLTFCEDGTALPGLLAGFLAPEGWGSWAAEEVACLGVRLVLEDGARADLVLRYIATIGPHPGWPGQVVSVFTRSACVADSLPLGLAGEIAFSVGRGDLTASGELVLALRIENICSPAEIGLSPDARRLGVGLESVVRLPSPASKA